MSLFGKARSYLKRRAAVRQHNQRLADDVNYRDLWAALIRAQGYKNARSPGNWIGASRSADGEISTDLVALRNRSRQLCRDDSVASGIIRTFTQNIIGVGIRPQARTGVDAKNKALEAVYKDRNQDLTPADGTTTFENHALLVGEILQDGDVLRHVMFESHGAEFETIEADRLATPFGKKASGSNTIQDGVERAPGGRPVRYWVTKGHPVGTNDLRNATDFVSVKPEFVRHLRRINRTGQTRGVPLFHACLQDLADIDLLLEASLKRMQVAACFAAFIKSGASLDDMLPNTANVLADKYGYDVDQYIQPGQMFRLHPGEEIQTLSPNFPTPELGPFVVTMARRIGAACGINWQQVLRDFSGANYSSARTDLLESRITFSVFQQWFTEFYLDWEWRQIMQGARFAGDPRMNGISDVDIASVRWIAPGWKWVDPVKEAQGAQIELEMGITSLRDLVAQKGGDWEDIQEQRILEEAREKELREQYGLPAREQKPAAQQPQDAEDNDEEDEEEPEAKSKGVAA